MCKCENVQMKIPGKASPCVFCRTRLSPHRLKELFIAAIGIALR